MGILVSIAGLDGSGKSAQSTMLQQALPLRGIRSKVIQIKELHYNKFDVMKDTLRYTSGRKLSDDERKGVYFAYVFKHQLKTNVERELENCDCIIMDRYVETQFYMYQFLGINSCYSDEILNEIAKPDICFYLNVSPAICKDRINTRGIEEDLSENLAHEELENLILAHDFYMQHQRRFGFVIMDGEQNRNDIHQGIMDELERKQLI